MPCNTVQTTTLAFEAANLAHLAVAMKTLGFTVQLQPTCITFTTPEGATGTYANGRLTLFGAPLNVQQVQALKVEYSRQCVLATCKARGWAVRFQPNGDILATRRAF